MEARGPVLDYAWKCVQGIAGSSDSAMLGYEWLWAPSLSRPSIIRANQLRTSPPRHFVCMCLGSMFAEYSDEEEERKRGLTRILFDSEPSRVFANLSRHAAHARFGAERQI